MSRNGVVIAMGGNALLRPGEDGTRAQQLRNAGRLARALVPLLRKQQCLLVVHGNGPQVGNLMLRMEESVTKVPALPLDFCVAQSQGEMGYLLEQALVNRMRRDKLEMPVACVFTQVRVDPEDAAFAQPTKPIGPFLNRYRAGLLRREGKAVVEDSGRGYRRVVASPRPQEVLGLETVRLLLDRGGVVIAGGGGGVPVVRSARGVLQGVEAVIDKDYTAGMMARELGADMLAFLTDVDQAYLKYGTREQKGLRTMSANQARAYLDAGEFPPGSMGPKVETALEFVQSTGGEALITSAGCLAAAMAGRSGTKFTPSNRLPFNGGSK